LKNIVKEGMFKKKIWAGDELAQARQLLDICNTYEGLYLKLDVEMLRSRLGKETNDFLYYEDGKLVGLLAMDEFGDEERELTGMVHPEHRRKGIFSALFAAAKEEAKSRGTERLILVCERFSHSGQGFVAAIGAAYDFSEHKMVLKDFKVGTRSIESSIDRITLRKAGSEDVETLSLISAASFGQFVEGTKRHILENMQMPRVQYYLGMLGNVDPFLADVSRGERSEEAVGCLNLFEAEREYGIYAFAVLPQYRRRGFGRQMLEQIIKEVHARNVCFDVSRDERSLDIALEVETQNENAIRLYRSCGFVEVTTYGYYNVDLEK
jgi:ribosomal protein S18 acetylase RimI-like enzyme